MMQESYPDIAELVPHRGAMLLVDRVVDLSDNHIVAKVQVTNEASFFRPGFGVPAYVGIEYMAQSIAAYDGAMRMRAGAPPEIGLLLGTRQFVSDRDYFREGEVLSVQATVAFNDGAMASFACQIDIAGTTAVTASLSVYRSEGRTDLAAGRNL